VRNAVTEGTNFAGSTDTDLPAANAVLASRSTRRLDVWAKRMDGNGFQPSGWILRLR
jgi:hypothetical protein